MRVKWDIVEDVIEPMHQSTEIRRNRFSRNLRRAVFTNAAAGLVLTASAVAYPNSRVELQQVAFAQPTAVQVSLPVPFRRPTTTRTSSDSFEDTNIGMSTRRLAQMHERLFVEDESPEEELTGDYSFL